MTPSSGSHANSCTKLKIKKNIDVIDDKGDIYLNNFAHITCLFIVSVLVLSRI